jgi:hypothetical protein
MICTEVTQRLRWEPHGVGLDRHPWGVGDVSEPAQRCSPSNGITIHTQITSSTVSGETLTILQ